MSQFYEYFLKGRKKKKKEKRKKERKKERKKKRKFSAWKKAKEERIKNN